jgi:hypothetical protein
MPLPWHENGARNKRLLADVQPKAGDRPRRSKKSLIAHHKSLEVKRQRCHSPRMTMMVIPDSFGLLHEEAAVRDALFTAPDPAAIHARRSAVQTEQPPASAIQSYPHRYG